MKHPLYYTLMLYTVMSFKYKQSPLIKYNTRLVCGIVIYHKYLKTSNNSQCMHHIIIARYLCTLCSDAVCIYMRILILFSIIY